MIQNIVQFSEISATLLQFQRFSRACVRGSLSPVVNYMKKIIKAFDHNYSRISLCTHVCGRFWSPCVHVGNDSAAVISEGKANEIKRVPFIKSEFSCMLNDSHALAFSLSSEYS